MKRVSFIAALILALCAAMALASAPKPTLTPDQALERLQRGNERFSAAKLIHPNQDPFRRTMTAKEGQKPFATILGCADSRVPLELVFDTGVGDLFVVRVAGNVTYFDGAGTIEYGADHLGSNLLVVLGHTKCGAVNAVLGGGEAHGNIPALVANIVPPVTRVKAENPGLTGEALANKAIEANTWQSIEDLFKQSPMMRDMVKAGNVKVVGAIYDIESGKVNWLGEHPKQAELVALTGGAK
ncbi:Carbonic anhydrase 2 [Fundidesulfovibrio magnetotacticus]|uniref:carbonic anhydrase n=1 Tax=Fundidesulfovibrio magnetotacticus TaxID=2730080 RepID=A0A6V8LU65_9BACT|nr:carbonic anhydrase [Fundidesulfovibrio magnetotacticus]GFK93187.1 Carbonic anhydrase 2 [Fundidesulfovibrio magnetotacticus]